MIAKTSRLSILTKNINGGDELSTASSKKKSILPVKLPVVPAKSQEEEDTRDDKSAKERSDGGDDDQQSTTSSKKSICSIKTEDGQQSTTSSKKSIGSIKSAAAALLKKKKVPSAGAEEQMGDDQSAIGELRNLVFMDSKHRELDKKRWEQKLKEAEKDKADRYRECVHVGLA
jgi:hypothetical protein